MMQPKIIDRFGREHTYLRISLTDHCNLRCFYCMPEEGIDHVAPGQRMSLEEILSLSRTFIDLGVHTVRLTGGEPLVSRDAGPLIRKLSEWGVTLKLTTNGILLDRYLDLLEETGLTRINVSLDSLDKAKAVFIARRDYFDQIMNNINRALERNFTIKLNVVLIKGVNDNEIGEFIRLTQTRDLAVKFIEFMPFKGNHWDWEKGVSEEIILERIGHDFGEIEVLERKAHSTSKKFRIPGHKGSFEIVSTITHPFCSDCNRIRLTSDGKMKNCLFATEETDLLTPLRDGQNVSEIILTAIQNKKHTRDGMTERMENIHFEANRSMISIGG